MRVGGDFVEESQNIPCSSAVLEQARKLLRAPPYMGTLSDPQGPHFRRNYLYLLSKASKNLAFCISQVMKNSAWYI